MPLLRRAYELWRELEQRAGEQLLHLTGSIDAGTGGVRWLAAVLRGARPATRGADLGGAGPALPRLPPAGRDGCRCSSPTAASCSRSGASSPTSSRRRRSAPASTPRARARLGGARRRVRVESESGRYEADRLVLCAGAWSETVARLRTGLVAAERQVLGLVPAARTGAVRAGALPGLQPRRAGGPLLRLPGLRHPWLQVRPLPPSRRGRSTRTSSTASAGRGRGAATQFRRALLPRRRRAGDVARDLPVREQPRRALPARRPPRLPAGVVAAGFSGHGFKFCSVIGEIVADLALDGTTRHEIDFLRLGRFR